MPYRSVGCFRKVLDNGLLEATMQHKEGFALATLVPNAYGAHDTCTLVLFASCPH
jgi:hypothetical protein